MNDSGMIKQLVMLVAIVLIGVFILTDVDWHGDSSNTVFVAENAPEGMRQALDPEKKIAFTDFRSGGAVRKRSSGPFDSIARNSSAASSTILSNATTTPFGLNRARSQPGTSSAPTSYQTAKIPTAATQRPAPPKTVKAPDASDKMGNEYPDVVSALKISGHIVDASGDVIEDLPLTLQILQASDTVKAEFGKKILNARSDEKGAYTFVNLVEGSYRVCTVEIRGYKPVCQNPRAPHSSADFTLRGTLNGKINGKVVDDQGVVLEGVEVSATPGQKMRVTTDAKGQYTIAMTVNKELTYQVYFNKKDYQRERIAVKGSDILAGKELNPVVKKTQRNGFDVEGTIYDQSGAPVSGQTVTLYSPTVKSAVTLRAASGPKGEFTIKYVLAADDYRLNVSTRAGYTFDAVDYQKIEVFDGMPPLQLEVTSGGKGSFNARVVQQNGAPLVGEVFTLYSGSSFAGRATSDSGGEVSFEDVPVQEAGSKLRISSTASPRYSFSGMSLAIGEHLSGLELMVDRGDNNLVVTVVDESGQPIQGVRGVLTWTHKNLGVLSQTSRSRGKISMQGSGEINFSELGPGEHRLQLSLSGYKAHSQPLDINQSNQSIKIEMIKN